MSFQAYLDNIQAKTGKSADDFKQLAERKGFMERGKLKRAVKAGQIVAWLKDEFALGHGHAMAIYATFKGFLSRSLSLVRRKRIAFSLGYQKVER